MPGAASAGQLAAAVVHAAPPTESSADDSFARMPVTARPIDLDDNPTPTPLPMAGLPAPDERRQKRILVVDDEADIRQLIVRVLRDRGYEVLEATQGAEALRVVQSAVPDLMILDAMLPEIHGFDVCRRIKHSSRYQHIPVIMISAIYRGWRYAEDVKKSYGADDFFEKPFRLVPLMRRVRELLKAGPAQVESQLDLPTAQQAYAQGVELYKHKHYEPAEKAFRQAVAADPFSAEIHYALANALLQRSQVFEAMREFEETVDLKPDMIKPLMNLAVLYQQNGFTSKAAEMWERALQKTDDDDTKREIRQQLLRLL
jgi:DNA-binding response OmpR family regulator